MVCRYGGAHHNLEMSHDYLIRSILPTYPASLANSFLLLSQTQAKSALSLKGIVKLSAADLKQVFPSSDPENKTYNRSVTMTQKDRLRAAVRGALGSRHPHEADISDSQFLGRADTDPLQNKQTTPSNPSTTRSGKDHIIEDETGTLLWEGQESNQNAVDEMCVLFDLFSVVVASDILTTLFLLLTGWNLNESCVIWTWHWSSVTLYPR